MKSVKALILRIVLLFTIVLGSLTVVEGALRIWSYVVLPRYLSHSKTSVQDFVVLTLGESTTAGNTPDVWPMQLEDKLRAAYPQLPVRVVNKAIPGTNTSVLVGNLERQIRELRPDVIVSMMGINDNYEAAFQKSVFIPNTKNDRFLSVRFARIALQITLAAAGSFYDLHINSDADYLDKWGSAYRIDGEYDLSEKYLLRSIALDPRGAGHYVSLAMLYRDMKRNREAENMLLIAKRTDPSADGVYIELGNFYRDNGEFALAEEMYNAALQQNPESWLAYGEYGILTSWYLKNDFKAEELYKQSIRLHPGEVAIYFELADIYRARGDWQDAIRLYHEVLMYDPGNTLAIRELGKTEQFSVGVVAGAAVDAHTVSLPMHPMTQKNYLRMIELAKKHDIRVVAVQYPLQSAASIRNMVEAHNLSISVVDNQKVFEEALKVYTYDELFTDYFGGNFGHATKVGNGLIADNVAEAIGKLMENGDTLHE